VIVMPKTERIESFTDYISFIEENCKVEEILFRGQQQDWSLVPKIGRGAADYWPKNIAEISLAFGST